MMRKQGPCSKCGVPCSSTWQNSKAIICNTCRLMEANTKDAEANHPSTSIPHQNVAFSVTQIGMIFGNLTFDPTTLAAIPLILRAKSEAVTADDDSVTQLQNHFHCGKRLVDSTIQIKQEHVSEGEEDEEAVIWDVKKVQRKKRSKLPQYTLSPLARFVNQLRHASYYRRRRRRRLGPRPAGPKYDDVLIYEKCAMHVPENEIGLGAELLSPPPVYEYSWKTMSFVAMNKRGEL